jgi:hypothetical protein
MAVAWGKPVTIVVPRARDFAPPRLTGCVAWLRSDLGLDPGQSNNTTAPNWRSLVAGTADCAQTTDAKRPVWHSSGGLNNRPYLSFNGNAAYTWAMNLGGAKTSLCIFRLAATISLGNLFSIYSMKRTSDNTFSEYSICNISGYKISSFRYDYQAASTTVGYDWSPGTTNGHYMITTYNGGTNTSTSSYTDTLDGTVQTLSASGAFGRLSTDLGSIGARLSSAQVVSFGCNCDLYEVAVYNRVISSAEITHLIHYAQNRYHL